MNMSSDVTHDILSSLSDFNTLSAAIKVSKSFYDVFQSHPKSIAHAVAANVAGEALPYAARVAHYVYRCSSSDARSPADLPGEDHFHGRKWELNRDMAILVEAYAKAVRTLENFYSLRYKDRTSQSSALDATEALRFARAVYRYILCYSIIERGGFLKDDDTGSQTNEEDEDEDEDETETERAQVHAGLCDFLKPLPSEDLFELMDICGFATDTHMWELRAWCHIGIKYGHYSVLPTDVMTVARRLEQRGKIVAYEDRIFDDFDPMSNAAREILRARKVPEARLVGEPQRAIIVSAIGDKDTCSCCLAERGMQLFGASNMDLLAGLLTIPERASLLPGVLPRNREETSALIRHLRDIQDTVSDRVLVGEMMDMELQGEDADNEHWSKEEWYCFECIKQLFRQRLMLWWREVKLRNGSPVQDDCWYGYNCRTMTHRSTHAAKLNHLCKPTRGDNPADAAGNVYHAI